jgi:hypothetical protein
MVGQHKHCWSSPPILFTEFDFNFTSLVSFSAMHYHFRDTVTNVDVSPEDMRSIIEVIADTGKFWY